MTAFTETHNKQVAFNRHILCTNKPPVLDSPMCLNWHLTQLWDPDGEFLEAAPVYLRQQPVNRPLWEKCIHIVPLYLSLSHSLSLTPSLSFTEGPSRPACWMDSLCHVKCHDWWEFTAKCGFCWSVPVYDAIAWTRTILLEPFKRKVSCGVNVSRTCLYRSGWLL